ncbi:Endoribonuclease L-PSP [Mucinivorans hirudinis]|uniref:Endoribonuclease L-PSP n=1 Tax=Mucinivorans hirudinis TaxID=1433126 RepID=A0A060R7R4_9BACT|nr:Endoribonuclease L-PSP [Mucinivorans hirudinis]
MKKIIHTDNAPAAVGPYSQAILAGNTLYISGQIPVNPVTKTVPETIEEQTEQCLKNVEAILSEAAFTKNDVVKSTVLLADMADFGAMNEVYAAFYTGEKPARVCYGVVKLPLGVKVEIETIAYKE